MHAPSAEPGESAISFRPMTEADLPLIRDWLVQPHVRRWYDDVPTATYPDDTIERYRRAIRAEAPTFRYMVELDGRLVGEIQSYRIDSYPEYAVLVEVDRPAIGIDLFIGVAELIGRGIGPRLIRSFLREVAFPRHGVDVCVIAPAKSNVAAIRAYEKAGFRRQKVFLEPNTREPEHLLLTVTRSELEPA